MDEFAKIPDAADEPPEADGKRVFRALVVGIDKYDDDGLATTMQFCSESAARMAEQLDASNYVVRQLHDHPGSDGRPTLAAVQHELAQMMEGADGDDTVLFYFGGHGVIDPDDRPVLLLADARPKGKRYVDGVLTIAQLLTALRGRPRFTVVLLDACHMGLAIDPELGKSTAEVTRHEQGGGFALLSGSTTADITQDATAGPISGGAFTLAVLAGLSGGAIDPDGGVRFSSLARFVQEHVERWKRSKEARTIDAKQRPVLRLEVADVQVIPAPRNHRDLTPPPTSRIGHAAFSPDGRSLATGEADGTVRVWDVATGKPLHPAIAHDTAIANVTFSMQGTEVVSVSKAGVTKVWSLTGGEAAETMRMKRRGEVHSVAWSDDGFTRAMATSEGLFRDAVLDVVIPETTRQFGRDQVGYHAVAYVPDMSDLVAGDADGNLCMWGDTEDGPFYTVTHQGPVLALAVSREYQWVATGWSGGAQVWDQWNDKTIPLRGHDGAVTAIDVTPDGKRVVTACRDGLVRVFETRTGKLLKTLRLGPAGRHDHPEASAVAFSPKGDRVFAGYSDGRGRLYKL